MDHNRPEVSNLLRIYSALSGKSTKELENEFAASSMRDFKEKLAGIIITKICPIGLRIEELLANQDYINEVLTKGNEFANTRAKQNIERIKYEMGMYNTWKTTD